MGLHRVGASFEPFEATEDMYSLIERLAVIPVAGRNDTHAEGDGGDRGKKPSVGMRLWKRWHQWLVIGTLRNETGWDLTGITSAEGAGRLTAATGGTAGGEEYVRLS
jgi:hypothetical protein